MVEWQCNECGKTYHNWIDDGNYNDCPDEDCCGCLNKKGV